MNFSQFDSLTIASSIIFMAVMVVFGLGFLINWARNRTVMAAYKRIGFWAILIVVGFELLILLLAARSLFLDALPVIVGIAVLMLRLWATVNNGIFFSNKLGLRSFPLFAPRLGLPVPIEPAVLIEPTSPIETSAATETAPLIESPLSALASPSWELSGETTAAALILPTLDVAPSLAPPVEPTRPARYWLTTLGVSVGAVVYSLLLFAVTAPSVGLVLRGLVDGAARTVTPVALLLVLEVAFTEELTFRLGMQNYLADKLSRRRHGYWIAIVFTSIVWTLGHAGALDPNWIKFAQIFPIGLALGWLYRRNGVESTIVAHTVFNVIGAFVISVG